MADVRFLRRCCSREFRSAFLELFPALKMSRSLRALAAYLLWTRPQEDGSVVVPHEVLTACAVTRSERRNTGLLLEEFAEKVAYLEIVPQGINTKTGEVFDYSIRDGKARAVKVSWPEEALELIAAEDVRRTARQLEVHFVDGIAYNRNARAQLRAEEQAAAQQGAPAKCAEAQEVLNYFNRMRSANPYTALLDRVEEVEDLMEAELEGDALVQQKRVLKNIRQQPQPFYRAVDGSVRLFETSQGLTYIKSRYRRALTADWVEYDLSASQLSAAAYVWDVPSLKVLFDNADFKPWDYFLGALGLETVYRAWLKKSVYGICYGAGVERLRAVADEFGVSRELVDRLLALPEIADLWEARERQFRAITAAFRARQPVVSAVGEVIRGGAPHKVLAQLMQAIEFKVIYPALKIAMEENVLVLFQHDGLSILRVKGEKGERLERQMRRVVEAEATSFGLRTTLERKEAA